MTMEATVIAINNFTAHLRKMQEVMVPPPAPEVIEESVPCLLGVISFMSGFEFSEFSAPSRRGRDRSLSSRWVKWIPISCRAFAAW
jgi:hypothetical protein